MEKLVNAQLGAPQVRLFTPQVRISDNINTFLKIFFYGRKVKYNYNINIF